MDRDDFIQKRRGIMNDEPPVVVDMFCGDCRDILPTLPDASIDCCVTSPPYAQGELHYVHHREKRLLKNGNGD